MKINEKTRFPYPVLSEDTRDFAGGYLDVEFGVREDNVANTLEIVPTLKFEHPTFKELFGNNEISLHADIHCQDTYYSAVLELRHLEGIKFPPGELSGRVVIHPLLIATQDIDIPAPDDLDIEFGLDRIRYGMGVVVGWAEAHVINVGRKKMAPIDSIFELALNEGLSEGQISVDPSSHKIRICAAAGTYGHIDLMRKQAGTQAVVLNAVYLPAIMEATSPRN